MPDEDNNLYLYEALELRSEYKSRIETLKNILPENYKWNNTYGMEKRSNDEPVDEFDVEKVEEEIKGLEKKSRMINNSIQATNFNNTINVNGENMSLAEALNLRKSVNEKIQELANKLTKSAYKSVEYKEDRNIEKKPNNSFNKVRKELEENRILFRNLNRAIREAGYKLTIDYKDE